MFNEAPLMVLERRPRRYGKQPTRAADRKSKVEAKTRDRAKARAAKHGDKPEGWSARLRERGHDLARAVGMLEQAMSMLSEPRPTSSARAESLRGAALLTLVAASELLVVAGWFEADQAVSGGSLES